MIRKSINELEGNEILARPVMTWDYQILLPAGAKVKSDYIEKLEDLGVLEVFVEEKEIKKTKKNQVAILKDDVEESVHKKVKEILEHHTYKHNEELKALGKEADSIITNILEEEKIVEKVFDIKERNTDIYEHSISICSLAILTALKCRITKSNIHDIGVACLLHDLGLRYTTIDGSDKSIEELNENEAREYKKHPITGYTALKDEKWISNAAKTIILSHHETMDGMGFPLKSEELSQETKIVSICDTFDELICGIFHKKMKVYEAIEYMKSFKGVKYDAKILDVFLSFTAVYPAGTKVLTNEGEVAIIAYQNKGFQDRPVIQILIDSDGKNVGNQSIYKDLTKIQNLFIEKVID